MHNALLNCLYNFTAKYYSQGFFFFCKVVTTIAGLWIECTNEKAAGWNHK